MRPYDYVIGIDPGYATFGISVIDIRGDRPKVVYLGSVLTLSEMPKPKKDPNGVKFNVKHYLYEVEHNNRIRAITGFLGAVLDKLHDRRLKLRALVVLEQWKSNPMQRNIVTAYWRGAADMAVAATVLDRGADVIHMDPIWVSQMSNPSGKFTAKNGPSTFDILTFVQVYNRSWLDFDAQEWIEERAEAVYAYPDPTKRVPKRDSIHYADALVMAVTGCLAVTCREKRATHNPKHVAVLDYVFERWNVLKDNAPTEASYAGHGSPFSVAGVPTDG